MKEIYNRRNLECQMALEKYEKDILDCKDGMAKFYSQYEKLNADIFSDNELEQILHP